MLLDANTVQKNSLIEKDICIIGAGAAGITIAHELNNHKNVSVCLLESGGLEFDTATNDLNNGTETGNVTAPEDNYLKSSRLRYFGGTTNHWKGWCRPLDELDFEKRPWVPNSGWPISRTELEPYYRKAFPIVDIKNFDYKAEDLVAENKPLLLPNSSKILTQALHRSAPTRFGQKYREELKSSKNTDVFLNANTTELKTNPNGTNVETASIKTLSGNTFSVKAKHFILACGGIENPRILLHSKGKGESALGNENDLVGRYFMEHLETQLIARIAITNPKAGLGLYFRDHDKKLNQVIYPALCPSLETQRKEQLLNCSIYASPKLRGKRNTNPFWRALGPTISELEHPNLPEDVGRKGMYLGTFKSRSEQSPNPNSRVKLSEEKDALGMQRIILDWNVQEFDRESTRKTLEIFARELGFYAEGRLNITIKDKNPNNKIFGGFHHMGTTRMGESIKTSVVDKNCKLHSSDNLFLAGSSVYPSCGWSNPTLTITALALRLAEHIKSKV